MADEHLRCLIQAPHVSGQTYNSALTDHRRSSSSSRLLSVSLRVEDWKTVGAGDRRTSWGFLFVRRIFQDMLRSNVSLQYAGRRHNAYWEWPPHVDESPSYAKTNLSFRDVPIIDVKNRGIGLATAYTLNIAYWHW